MTDPSQLRREGDGRARPRDGYTRFVSTMKFALPSLAFAIIAAALFWPNFVSTGKQATDIARDSLTPTGLRNFTMESPVFVSTDDRNRPYRLTATRARQVDHKATTVVLDAPEAKIVLDGGVQLRIEAEQGRFDRDSNRLTLTGNVNVFHGRNHRFRTAEATIDMKNNRTWGRREIHATGPEMTVAAEGFAIDDKGMTVRFTGRTRATLHLDRADLKDFPDRPAAEPSAVWGFGQ